MVGQMNRRPRVIPSVDKLVLPLARIGADDVTLVGGKAANLGEMTRVGFPIPEGFCITTTCFQRFMAASAEQTDLYAALDDVTPLDLERLKGTGFRVRQALSHVAVPQGVVNAIVDAWQSAGRGFRYAVRSSATAEDTPGASFAGQHDTLLNIRGEAALIRSIRECWLSLFTDRAIIYRIKNGFPHRAVNMAVIVQHMVESDVSGILFTADPVSGRRHIVSIDASFGLGEALVSGLVTADAFQVDKRTWDISASSIADKQFEVRPSSDGGTLCQEISSENRLARSLTTEQAIELARLGTQIEALFGDPQDIEWAIHDRRIYILQSRPITTLFPLPSEALRVEALTGELQVMFSFGSIQGILEPMTRLGQDAIKGTFAGAATLFGFRGVTSETQRVVWAAAERLFVNFTAAARHPIGRRALRRLLGVIEPSVSQAMVDVWDDPRLKPGDRWFKLSTTIRIIRVFAPALGRLILAWCYPNTSRKSLQFKFEKIVADFEQRSRSAGSLAARISLFEELMRTAFATILPAFIPVIGAGLASLKLLNHLAARLPQGDVTVLRLSRGLPHNVTTQMDLALWDVATRIRSDRHSLECFVAQTAPELADCYLNRRLPEPAQSAVNSFLDRYGMRGVGEIDLGRARWREDPTPIVRTLQSYLRIADPVKAPDRVFKQGAVEAEAAAERLSEELRLSRGGWFRLPLARAAIQRLRALAGLRESPKFLIMRLFDLVRTGLMQSGKELVASGLLEREDDLFFLELGELKSMAAGDGRDWKGLVAERRALYASEQSRQSVPRLLLSDGHAFYEGVRSTGKPAESVLTGSPVSPGVAVGEVRILADPHSCSLAPGEILVCRGTDPAWTPLFLAAGGLVMEVGGLMTHGSVVAREYGIPAVVGVHEATSRLRNGQLIRVDGSAGEVIVVASGMEQVNTKE